MAEPTWVRVEQPETGHRLDVHRDTLADLPNHGYKILEDYPPNLTDQPRPPKYRTNKDGTPARRSGSKTSTTESGE